MSRPASLHADLNSRVSVIGDGSPVVLLHGWGLGRHTYREVARRIADEGFRVMTPSLPGFGGTPDLPPRELSLSGYARWLERMFEHFDVSEPVVLIGHSFGGGVAIRFAHDFPERVRSLVLVNSIGGSVWRRGNTLKGIAQRPLWDWGLHFPGDVWPLAQATKVVPVIVAEALPNLVRNPWSLVKVGNIARTADLTTELETLRQRGLPVTVLWGNRDGIVTRDAFEAMCAVLGTRGRVVDGSHSWLLANPDTFGEMITNDLAAAEAAAATSASRQAGDEQSGECDEQHNRRN